MGTERTGWQRFRVQAAKPEPPLALELDLTADGSAAPSPELEVISSTSLFPEGCEARGVLRLEKSIRFQGEFHGAVVSKGTVTIEAGGALQADIRARSVIVRGAVMGDIDAGREVVITSTARVHGSIRTPSLVVERGAFVSGNTDMFRPLPSVQPGPALRPAASASPSPERKAHEASAVASPNAPTPAS